MDLGLRGRAAFVAASSKGMGRAIAQTFAAEGADVGMCARGAAELDAAAASVRAHGVRVAARPCDLAVAGEPERAVDEAASELGRLDALVVNAGGPPPGTFATMDDEAWRAGHELTLMSAVRLVRAALPHLRRSDAASILFVSSYTVRQPVPLLVASNSIRLSVVGLAKSLANELAPAVRVNTLVPGLIRTERSVELARARAGTDRTVDEVIAEMTADVPLGRFGEPEEFARAAVFLCSAAASYVTGTVLACDGGIVRVPV
jgi:3-oxoacyl-[acyl-carrier protein] reductase